MKSLSGQKKTLAAGQKRAAILMALAILILIGTLIFVKYLVSIETFTDLDGTEYSVKKSNGTYALFDQNGYIVETYIKDDELFYITPIGTLVSVSENGDAVIDTYADPEDGEGVAGVLGSLTIYPAIQTANITNIRIINEYGSYAFTKNESGSFVIKGREDSAYDETLLATLRSFLATPYLGQRISDLALETYGYEEYGLDDPQATVIVTTKDGIAHTLYIGKQIVSGAGYYVRSAERDRVYIVLDNSIFSIGSSLLVPLETYVTPVLIYPVTTNNYMLVENFRVDSLSYAEDGTMITDNDIALTYWDYAERQGTEFESQPYVMTDDAFSGYTPSADSVYTVMYNFLEMSYKKLVKVGVTDDDLKEYGLDKPVKSLYFELTETDSSNKTTYHAKTYVFFSEITEDGTYYATSSVYVSNDGKKNYVKWSAYDQIVEIDRSMIPFMEWDTLDWVELDYFRLPIATCDTLEFTSPTYNVTFDIVPVNDDVEAYVVTETGRQKLDIKIFKTLYLNMQYGKFFGSTKMSESELAAIIADPSRHMLSWSMKTTVSGIERTFDYYWLDENKTLVTINGVGEFYVLTTAVTKLVQDAIDVSNGIKITAVTPYTSLDK